MKFLVILADQLGPPDDGVSVVLALILMAFVLVVLTIAAVSPVAGERRP